MEQKKVEREIDLRRVLEDWGDRFFYGFFVRLGILAVLEEDEVKRRSESKKSGEGE